MGNKTKAAIILLIGFLLIQTANAQNQMNIPDYLKQKFIKYTKAVPREEIFVLTDREEFIAGEDLWFTVFLIDRQGSRPSLNSRIVYFELLNAENRPVIQKRILIDKGFGSGHTVLPDTLSSGIYTIRAYTSYMKNFLPNNCFMKDVVVYNTFSNRPFQGKSKAGKSAESVLNNKTQVSLDLNNSISDTLEIFVNANNQFRSENKNPFYIFIQTRGNINYLSTEKILGETTKIIIPKAKLNEGINQITLFNSKGEPVAERFNYTPVKENNLITLHAVDSCNLRDKIILELEPEKEISTSWNSTIFGVSVSPQTSIKDILEISDYMVFASEFGFEPWNIINDRKISQLTAGIMDSILLSISSNWIDWDIILKKQLPHYKYIAEKEYHHVSGKLSSGNQPVPAGENIIMCTPGKNAVFQYAKTDKEGNFSFNIHIDEALKDLIIMPDNVTENYRVAIESSFSYQFLPADLSVDSNKTTIPDYMSRQSVNYQVSKIYGANAHGDSKVAVFKPFISKRIYGKPDIELIMADYIKLPVMQEVFIELLPNVSLKKKNSGYEIIITDRVDNSPYLTIPTLMIDGVIIKDPNLIINLDPEIVEKIDVVKEKYVVGEYFFPGIINVITNSADFNCIALPDYMIRLPYKVIDPVSSFVSPDFSVEETKSNRIPDYRNSLFWNPSVKLDKDGNARIEFWSSDIKGDYLINIQGFTNTGKLFSIRKSIKVK